MSRTPYLAVRNWERYQHYKDGRPLVWVKFHIALLDDPELRALPAETRLLWDQLLLLAGRTDNCIRRDYKWISEVTAISIECTKRGTETLVKGAWLSRFDSRLSLESARRKSRISLEQRREELEKKPPSPPYRKPKTKTLGERIEAMVRNGVITDETELKAELAAAHLNSELETKLRDLLRPR
jgi:hypothetical protein